MTAIGSESIRDILSTAGPCITIVSSNGKLADAINIVRNLLRERGVESEALLAPVLKAEHDRLADGRGRGAVAILRAAESIRVMPAGPEIREIVKVSDRFDVRTLLGLSATETAFHILALSQKRTRILRVHAARLPGDSISARLSRKPGRLETNRPARPRPR